MRRFLIFLSLVALGQVTLVAQPKDVVYRQNLGPIAGKILRLDSRFLYLEVQVVAGQPPAQTSIPRETVSKIQFAPDPKMEQFLETAQPGQLSAVAASWRERESLLSIANSNTGQVGLALGRLLLESDSPTLKQQALALYQRLEKEDWNKTRQQLAQQGKLRAMIANGMAADAVAEARAIAETAEDPAVLIEAKYVLAEAAFDELQKLLNDNPRWMEDVRVRPVRHRLYNEAIELYLFPFLFHGAQEEAASRGIKGAIRVFEISGESESGRELANDIVLLYPNGLERVWADEFLKNLPKPTQQPHDEATQES